MGIPWNERYFRPKAFEADGRLYAWLGVTWFKRRLMGLVQADPARPHGNAYFLGGRSLDHVRTFERRSRRSEVFHLIWLVVALLFLALSALSSGLSAAGAVVFAANFHCFLLQRYNRARVYRLLGRRTRG